MGWTAYEPVEAEDLAAGGEDERLRLADVGKLARLARRQIVGVARAVIASPKLLLAVNGFVRRDHVTYTPSADPFSDTPGTVAQDRRLTNVGVKVDFSYAQGAHNVKFGGTIAATKLKEDFSLGLTDSEKNDLVEYLKSL